MSKINDEMITTSLMNCIHSHAGLAHGGGRHRVCAAVAREAGPPPLPHVSPLVRLALPVAAAMSAAGSPPPPPPPAAKCFTVGRWAAAPLPPQVWARLRPRQAGHGFQPGAAAAGGRPTVGPAAGMGTGAAGGAQEVRPLLASR